MIVDMLFSMIDKGSHLGIIFFVIWQGSKDTFFRHLAGFGVLFFGKYFRQKAVVPFSRATRGPLGIAIKWREKAFRLARIHGKV